MSDLYLLWWFECGGSLSFRGCFCGSDLEMFDQSLGGLFCQLVQRSDFHWIVVVVDKVLCFFVFFGWKFAHSCNLRRKLLFRYISLQSAISFGFANRLASQRAFLMFLRTYRNGFCWSSIVLVLLLRWEGPVDDILTLIPTTVNRDCRWIWLQLEFLFLFHFVFLVSLDLIHFLLFFFSDYFLLFSSSFADRHFLKRSFFDTT